MQIVLFLSFFVAEIAASALLFQIAPLNPICVWYPSGWVYALGHFIPTLLVVLVTTIVWCVIGNPAFWESICRTHERSKVLLNAGLAGLGIDLIASLLAYYVASFNAGGPGPDHILPWLLLRAGLWSVAYAAAGGAFLGVLQLDLRSRRIMSNAHPK